MSNSPAQTVRWEHFHHGSDIGIRGIASSKSQAFEMAALALTAVITMPESVRSIIEVGIRCQGTDDEFLFVDWINALIFESATRNMLFSRFAVALEGQSLQARVWGEAVDIARHHPAVEPKGATFTELKVRQDAEGFWIAQCVVDV